MRPHGWAYYLPYCEVFERIEHSPLGVFMRESRFLVPIVEIVHLLGLALFAGPLLLIDLGLLGIALRRQPVHQLAAALSPYTWTGFALLMLTGPLMFTAQATKWHDNGLFWFKTLILIAGTIFQLAVWRSVRSEFSALTRAREKFIGVISLSLWLIVAFSAKMMEFV